MIRLAGAWLVLISHSFALTGRSASEPLAVLLGGAIDGGRLAVDVFFVVSGFLVTRSALMRTPRQYARARALRIWPAMAVAIVVQTLVIGPICTVMPIGAYLANPATWAALLRGLLFNPQRGLPGVFAANPFAYAVNGSLWTLRVEAACYILLLAACGLGLLGRWTSLASAGLALMGAAWLQAQPHGAPGFVGWMQDVRIAAILECCLHFAMGALLWVHRDTLPRSFVLCGVGLLALWTVSHTVFAPILFHAVFAYAVICLGLARQIGSNFMHRLGDISFGTYLYAFPVQQVLVNWSGGAIGPWRLIMEAALPVLVLAVLSQRLIERPALRAKYRVQPMAAALPRPFG